MGRIGRMCKDQCIQFVKDCPADFGNREPNSSLLGLQHCLRSLQE